MINLDKTLRDNNIRLERINDLQENINNSTNQEILNNISSVAGENINNINNISSAQARTFLSIDSQQLTPESRDILEKITLLRQLNNDQAQAVNSYYETLANEQQNLNQQIKSITEGFDGLADQAIELSKSAKDIYKDLLESHKDFMRNIEKSVQETQLQIKGLITQIKGITTRLNLKSALTPGLDSMFSGIIDGIINGLGTVQSFAMQKIEAQQRQLALQFETEGMRQQAEQFRIQIDSANANRANVIAQRTQLITQRDEMMRQWTNMNQQYNELGARVGNTPQIQQMYQNLEQLSSNITNLNSAIQTINIPREMNYGLVNQQHSQISRLNKFKQSQLAYQNRLEQLQNREALLDSANSIIRSYNQVSEQIANTAKDVQKQVKEIQRMGAELLIDPNSYQGRLSQITNQINNQYDNLEDSTRERLEQIKKEMQGLGDLRRAEAELAPIIAKLKQEGQFAQAEALQKSLAENIF